MILEGVIVCVNYHDILAHTLPYNKHLFNNLVVVTDTKDYQTKALCDYYFVRCIQTDVFYEDGPGINKAKGINEGLKYLTKEGWVLQLDADIYLPPLTRFILDKLPLDETCIYGCDRLMCANYQEWQEFICCPKNIQEAYVYIHPDAFRVGVRIAEYKNTGYTPIGFFQLWNPKGSEVYKYPDKHGKIDRSDVLMAKHWDRRHRQFLPEILVIHLDSEKLEMGANWNGRKTKLFGPEGFEGCGYKIEDFTIDIKNEKENE